MVIVTINYHKKENIMPTYWVNASQTVHYQKAVEADSEDEVEHMFYNGMEQMLDEDIVDGEDFEITAITLE
jgi:hypothetical protein